MTVTGPAMTLQVREHDKVMEPYSRNHLTSGNTPPRYTPSTQERAHSRTSNARFADQRATQLRNPGGPIAAERIGELHPQLTDAGPAHSACAGANPAPAVQ